MNGVLLRVTLALFPCCLAPAIGCAGTLDGEVESNYGYSEWRDVGRTNYMVCVGRFELPELQLPTNGLPLEVNRRTDADEDGLFVFSGDDVKLRIGAMCCPSVLGAHESMLDVFSSVSSVVPFVRMTNCVGDVSFRHARTSGEHMVFSRNNVLVDITAYDAMFDATNIASQVDAAILRASRGIAGGERDPIRH